MRSEMISKAVTLGMTVIDLDALQRERFARDRQRFEFSDRQPLERSRL